MIRLNILLLKVNNSSKIQKSLATYKALPQIVEKSILEAADRKPILLEVAVEVEFLHIAIVVIHVAIPGAAVAALRRTPKENIVPNIKEPPSLFITITTGESRKTTFICCSSIWTIPIGCANRFHLTTCHLPAS